MEKILRIVEKFIPKKLYKMGQPIYHYLLTTLGAFIYGFPARKLHIIGVTGTKGKSTTVELINSVLEANGYKTALTNTIRFKIDEGSRPNKYKMSMPGRFFMQKFLAEAVSAGCTHAVIEITSEGSKQFRHKYIDLDSFVFTNLSPEHIESHGSYEKYRQAKLNIVDNLIRKSKEGRKTMMVVNGEDKESELFLNRTSDWNNKPEKISFSLSDFSPIKYDNGIEMRFHDVTLYSKMNGEFNAWNILAAATTTRAMGISDEIIKKGVESLEEVAGRAQKIEMGQNFKVIIDYAHTPNSLEELYKAFNPAKNSDGRKICILGNTGGGRDTWKRPVMAKIAEQYCDDIILANEDPYNEDPAQIVAEMKRVIKTDGSNGGRARNAQIILDRRDAIAQALKTAHSAPGSVVLISGKGTDPFIMGKNGNNIPWSDADVTKEELSKILK
jgi:UDP-N-acetylmuramoyl-L-alanyl-D-glutamate--2,6-diaminopimelate ligase